MVLHEQLTQPSSESVQKGTFPGSGLGGLQNGVVQQAVEVRSAKLAHQNRLASTGGAKIELLGPGKQLAVAPLAGF